MQHDAQLDLVRTRLPEHIINPNPEIYNSDNYIVLDFETTTRSKGTALDAGNSIVMCSFELGPDHHFYEKHQKRPHSVGREVFSVWGGEYDLGELVARIEEADFLVAHNCKFELQWLQRCGLDLTKVVVYDTMLGEYVLGGNRHVWQALSLERSAQRRFGTGKHNVVGRMFKAGLCSTEIPASWLQSYCEQDVALCRDLFLAQRKILASTSLLAVQYTRCLATPVLADVEFNGMQLDPEKINEMIGDKEREYAEIQNELEVFTGGINTNSPKQLGEYLYDVLGFAEVKDHRGNEIRTKSGARGTSVDVIERLKARNTQQAGFLDLYKRSKELYNELTKYLRKFRDCCEEVDGRLTAQFNQSNTQTHRLSSSGLHYRTQFQNFPRAYKPAFTARRRGWVVGEADGAQLEFRVAAHLGRDRTAIRDIILGTDIHSVTAGIIGCTRQEAKAHTFKPLYGGRSGTPDEVRYYEYFREKYDGITATQRRWVNDVLKRKVLTTEWGLKYYWPNTRQERSGYITNSTAICNYPVQAFATAEIIPIGLVYFWHYAKAAEMEMLIVNTIHDSIITEMPPEEVETFHVLSRRCLINEVYGYLDKVYDVRLVVPLGAGVMTGEHWSDQQAKAGETTYTAQEDMYESIL